MARARGRDSGVAWTRRKLLLLLATTAAVILLLVTGLVLVVVDALDHAASGRRSAPSGPNHGAPSSARRGVDAGDPASNASASDQLASQPMVSVPESASHPSPISLTDPGPPILLPSAHGVGPAGVPTGFPHTPEGAMAQLAAIDQTALSSGNLVSVRAVITGWALPGGPIAATWSGVRAMAHLFTAAGLSGGGASQLVVSATPLMGLVKGNVGADFVVPCIDLELDVTLTMTARGAVADCQRMVWQDGRWWIGPGAEPAAAPSVWPDSELAVKVGYRDLRHE
jgi:hypothetical protein